MSERGRQNLIIYLLKVLINQTKTYLKYIRDLGPCEITYIDVVFRQFRNVPGGVGRSPEQKEGS